MGVFFWGVIPSYKYFQNHEWVRVFKHSHPWIAVPRVSIDSPP